VSKALDKMAGAEREVVGRKSGRAGQPRCDIRAGRLLGHEPTNTLDLSAITAPATDLARQWDGWGTALKPGVEFWWLARAPLSEPTVAANVAKHGTGALNIGASRIHYQNAADKASAIPQGRATAKPGALAGGMQNDRHRSEFVARNDRGRWPANVVLSHTLFCEQVGTRRVRQRDIASTSSMRPSGYAMGAAYEPRRYADPDGYETIDAWDCAPDCPVFLLDQQAGERNSGGPARRPSGTYKRMGEAAGYHGIPQRGHPLVAYSDHGGASRFYYCSKPSTAERNRGLPDGQRNQHPTVKPLALMRWLLTLVTPPGGRVLDPFAGSGTTLLAAREMGLSVIGIEQAPEHCALIVERLRGTSTVPA
jgi:hypothetical protein